MKKIIRLTENDLTKLIKRILVESKFNEPKVIKNYYESFDEAYSFMLELDEYLNELAPSDEVCNDEHLKMLHRIYNTAGNKVRELREKYDADKYAASTTEKAFADGSVDQKINDFIKKYDGLPDKKFYEFAELFSKEIGIPFEKMKEKRLEFIDKKFNKLLKPSYDKNSLRKDPLYKQTQEMFTIAGKWLDCCEKGYYDCDDDDNGDDDYNYTNYKEPNVKYDSIKGGENVPDEFGVERKKGKEMYEHLKRRIKRYL